MKQNISNEIIANIEKLNIKDSLKQELYYFNQKLEEILNTSHYNQFDIIIDNMSKENINILLEYTTDIIEKYQLYNDFIKYRRENRNLEDITNSVIIIDDFSIFKEHILDSWKRQENFDDFFTNLKLNNNMLIITCTNKLENNLKDIKSKVFNPNLCIHLLEHQTQKELYQTLLEKYQKNNIKCNLTYTTFKTIITSIDDNYYLKHFDLIDYLYDYSIKKMLLENKKTINNKIFSDIIEIKEDTKKKESELNNLIGLNKIKQELESLYNYLEFTKKLKKNDQIYLNMFFLGNPGTGKTTIARMYAKKLYDLGFIKENKLIEVTPNDLMGKYVGQTKDTIRKIFDKSTNGVLFIDEAYLISEDIRKNISYMKEALIELLKYLDNPKNIVIFAGYADKMKNLYDDNPGIKSRIYKEIIFEDYNTDELYQILKNDLEEKGLTLDLKSKNKIIKYINILKNDNNFGNARTIKQLSQKMIINHANEETNNNNLLIDYLDLPKENNTNNLKIGFGIYD